MTELRLCLWFARDAEEAARFYVSLVPGSAVERVQYAPGGQEVLLVYFTLGGVGFMALNAGTAEVFGNGASIAVTVEGQAEVDRVWAALLEGGSPMACGWIRDRFGVPWQVVPAALGRLMAGEDAAAVGRVFTAMRGMVKLDVAGLERAAAG